MNFKRKLIGILTEMFFAIFIIMFSLNLWINFDKTTYETANYYSKIKGVVIDISDEPFVLSSDESKVESNTLYLHNISNSNNSATLMIKINKSNILFLNNTILKIDNDYYNLKELNYEQDNTYYYIILKKVDLSGYETKLFNIKLLTKDNINTNIKDYLDYEFISKV